jgi:hypothetical protein
MQPVCRQQVWYIVVMRDRGRQLDAEVISRIAKSNRFFQVFQKIADTAIFLAQYLPKGDVLPHHLVYDTETGEVTLIDIDEGISINSFLPERTNQYNGDVDGFDCYRPLSYPNPLREDPVH